MKILLVEDEPQLSTLVGGALRRVGHEVETALSGPDAVEMFMGGRFDLVVLDVNLPGFDGFEVLKKLRSAKIPARVIMLTARGEVRDRVAGLKSGADDYLTKPFAMEELLARVDVLSRRNVVGDNSDELCVGDLVMETGSRRVALAGVKVELSPREFEVLQVLMKEPGRVFSRDEICERIWEREHEYDTRTVEIFVMRIRKKIDRSDGESFIRTVRGVGYAINPQ